MRPFAVPGLQRGTAYYLMGQEEEARWHLEKFLEGTREQQTIDDLTESFRLSFQSIAYAMLGDFDSALAAAEQAMLLFPAERDALFGQGMFDNQTWVMAMAGQRDEALERIATSIGQPNGLIPMALHKDPNWDFFRDDERFNKLIKPANLKEASQ